MVYLNHFSLPWFLFTFGTFLDALSIWRVSSLFWVLKSFRFIFTNFYIGRNLKRYLPQSSTSKVTQPRNCTPSDVNHLSAVVSLHFNRSRWSNFGKWINSPNFILGIENQNFGAAENSYECVNQETAVWKYWTRFFENKQCTCLLLTINK